MSVNLPCNHVAQFRFWYCFDLSFQTHRIPVFSIRLKHLPGYTTEYGMELQHVTVLKLDSRELCGRSFELRKRSSWEISNVATPKALSSSFSKADPPQCCSSGDATMMTRQTTKGPGSHDVLVFPGFTM
mmetsp:Transcript_11453/g.16316  ORF Transcript_11453/g.16316 Transcript_11453/m.16316 type:complete len:129 (-) Transcript_11453:2348-2734(-)